MKSILKVRILGIDYYTMKQVSINKTIECEELNFIDKVIPPIKINKGKYELPETIVTAKQQADTNGFQIKAICLIVLFMIISKN